jgi:hypothetical protein
MAVCVISQNVAFYAKNHKKPKFGFSPKRGEGFKIAKTLKNTKKLF